jgi:hypothetical protein
VTLSPDRITRCLGGAERTKRIDGVAIRAGGDRAISSRVGIHVETIPFQERCGLIEQPSKPNGHDVPGDPTSLGLRPILGWRSRKPHRPPTLVGRSVETEDQPKV